MKKVKQVLSMIDLFGSPVSLLHNNSIQYSTLVGSFISLGIYCFTFVSFVNMTNDLFGKSNPNIIMNVEHNDDPEPFRLDPSNFLIAVAISNLTGYPVINVPGQKFFEPRVQACSQHSILINGIKQIVPNCTNYTMERCKEQKLDQHLIENLQLGEKEMEYGYCINQKQFQEKPITVQGVATSESYTFIIVEVLVCQNSTTESQCASRPILEKVLAGGYVAILLTDYKINLKKSGNPFTPMQKLSLSPYQIDKNKFYQFQYSHVKTETTENMFYYQPKTYTDETLQLEESTQTDQQNLNKLLFANMFLSQKELIYFRTYNNLLDIFGAIGGLYKMLVILASILLVPLTKLAQNFYLVNQIFSFELINQQFPANISKSFQSNNQILPDQSSTNIHKQKRQRSSKQILSIVQNRQKEQKDQEQKVKIDEQELRKIKDYLKQKQNTIGGSKLINLCNRQKFNQIKYGLDRIQQKLDITFILRKLIEIDKLKLLLLSPDQAKLFDYLPKPAIPSNIQNIFEYNQIGSLYFQNEKNFEVKVKEAFEAYKLNKFQNNDLSIKLIRLMDNEIKELFDQVLGYFQSIYIKLLEDQQQIDQTYSRGDFMDNTEIQGLQSVDQTVNYKQ